MTRIILCGANGKMGRVVADIAEADKNCIVVAGIDINENRCVPGFPVFKSPFDCDIEADVIVDFSHPSVIGNLISYATKKNLPLVVATTGYNDEQISAIKIAAKSIPVFFTFNMSLGINLMTGLAMKAAEVLGEGFDIEIIEKHHNQKLDAPSGTAIMLADALNEARGGKMLYKYDRHTERKKRSKNEIGIHAVRGGTIVGEHEIIFAGRDEVLSITHIAQSKEIFASGAVKAALFLAGQKPGLYDMSNLI